MKDGMFRLVAATGNQGKLRELKQLLAGLPIELVSGIDLPEVPETGSTFEENACLKARAAAVASGEWALADDSGLEVDALDGAPGIHSNRFAGEGSTEESRNRELLRLLEHVEDAARTCRYRAALAICSPEGECVTFFGSCEGLLLREARGSGGFGYDPLFYLPQCGCTVAELGRDEKNRISHRAHAVRAALPFLRRLCGAGQAVPAGERA